MRKLLLPLCAACLILLTGFLSVTPMPPTDSMILVNKSHPLPSDYVPPDLRVVRVRFAEGVLPERKQMASEAAVALEALFTAAQEDGVTLYAVSGYRSYGTQSAIYKSRLEQTSLEYVSKYIAQPGQSEHQTGLAMDLLDRDSRNLTEAFADTEAYAWLCRRAWEFGFLIRYTREGERETGYAFEPWHVRYVGDAAGDIYRSGLTYEAWLARRDSFAYARGRAPLIAR